jgi:hypothetical protein
MTRTTIAIRMWTWAAVLRVLKHAISFDRLVSLVQQPATSSARSVVFVAMLDEYLSSAGRFPFRAPANCLERSLAAYRLLCIVDAEPELVVGVRRSAVGVEGHVWVRVDGRALAERPEHVATFAVVAVFDASAQRRTDRDSASIVLADLRLT